MKLGLIGLPQSGKKTVFEALTLNFDQTAHHGEARIAAVRVPDQRVDRLSAMYQPKKTTFAQVAYYLPGPGNVWTTIRDCDALIHVVRNFGGYGFPPPSPQDDFNQLDDEMILADLVSVEKRLERLAAEKKKHRDNDPEEEALLVACRQTLEDGRPLRSSAELAAAPQLRGFAFVSAKPQLVLLNNTDDDDHPPQGMDNALSDAVIVMRGKLENELAQMTEAEAEEFLSEFNITASAMDRVIHSSYQVLGLISFFTVGDDEVRAWTIRRGTPALEAAAAIHTDIKKGFIRAEVVAYDDLMTAGSIVEARKQGTVRLESKTYTVMDGDIIHFRFNV